MASVSRYLRAHAESHAPPLGKGCPPLSGSRRPLLGWRSMDEGATNVTLREAVTGTVASLRRRGVRVVSTKVRLAPVLEELGVRRPRTLEDTLSLHHGPARWTTVDAHAANEHGETSREATVGVLGRFEIEGELGRGGMGRILEARDPELRRQVAVKVLLDPDEMEPEHLARFVAEAQLTSQLQHPNIVPVHEIGVTEEGELFFVMKRVTGRSLGDVLRDVAAGTETEWTRRRLLNAFVQIGQALAYAHDRGVLHRDLKPDNVMLGSFGEVLVMDWGLARVVGDAPERITKETIDRVAISRTLDGAVIGTAGYMSPEQAQGLIAHLDGRSDVFSLGAMLYELLTGSRPYEGEDVLTVLLATLQGPPEDPRLRAPERNIPEELAEIALKAMARSPADRYPTASALVRAVEDHLEGARRAAEAGQRVGLAEAMWSNYERLHVEETELQAREKALAAAVKPWAPLEDPGKRELMEVRDRLEELGPERATKFGKAVAAAEQALSHAPDFPDAKDFLARAYWSRFEAAERARDVGEQAYYADRVREYDRGVYLPKLEGIGALTLATDPPGAEVWCERYEQKGLVWPLVEKRLLGRTPIEGLPMEMGSYLLTIVSPGKRDTKYPAYITRGKHWHSGDAPIPLFTDEEIGEGFVYVPAGEFLAGGECVVTPLEGFSLGRTPVSVREYVAFLNALHASDPELAWLHAPKKEEDMAGSSQRYWREPGPGGWTFPLVDVDGDEWLARYPVLGITWDDAVAYARWSGADLPGEQMWEKAARGADARIFPWGTSFDPTLCLMEDSLERQVGPLEIGARPQDRSPYGALDMAGGVRDWCRETRFNGEPGRRPVRGGAWCAAERVCQLTNRFGYEPSIARSYMGLRLARTDNNHTRGDDR